MLYYLFRYLEEFGVPGSGMWQYISFRSLLTLILSLLISMWFGERFIQWMKAHGGNETQRDASIDPYGVEKKGVPTMGGIIIIVAIVIPCLLFGRLRNVYMILMIGTTLWLGLLGLLDDYIKMKHSKDGLRPIWKLAGQALLGLVVGLTLWLSPDAVIRENVTMQRRGETEVVVHKSEPVKSTITTIPFVKSITLAYVGRAGSNGSNMNDGMDGMCAGNSAIIGLALGILAYVSSHIQMASYLNIMYVSGSEELVIFLCAFVGALVGFLWYNAYPAQVFMGDTGSLTIGGIIAVTAIIIHKELLLPILCFIFFVESVSVILQTQYAKMGNKRGQKWRVFKRAPIHDAFRIKPGQLPADFKILINWPKGCWLESKITTRFWIVTIILAALTIVTLKIR